MATCSCRAVRWPYMNNGWRIRGIDRSTGQSRAGQSGRCWPLFCPPASCSNMVTLGWAWLLVGSVGSLQKRWFCSQMILTHWFDVLSVCFNLPCLSLRPPTATDPASSCPKVAHSPFESGPRGPGSDFPESRWEPGQERRDGRLPSPRGLRHKNQLIWTQGRPGETKGSRRKRE